MVADGHRREPEGGTPPGGEALARAGACFGFEVRSQLRFAYLRAGSGTPLVVREDETPPADPSSEPLRVWEPSAANPFHAKLYGDLEAGYRLWIGGLGWYQVFPEAPEIRVPPDVDPVLREERLWGIPATLCFLARGDIPLHAAAVEVGGSAILFGAPGRFGKTTLAAAFLAAGHRILSEDVSCLRLSEIPWVLPGPAMLRVRTDSFAQLRLPGVQPVARDADRVHVKLDVRSRGGPEPVPMRAVVLLRGASERPTLEREDPAVAVRDLWALSFKVPTDADRVRCFQAVADVASDVPVWNLRRPLRFDALPQVVEAVIEMCLRP